MALQATTNINVDFYDKKYILVNAKQHDKNSRFISISCYNNGKFYPVNEGEHSAYIRYKKSDNNSVFNFCEIDRKGNIIVELTEQMLALEGFCSADLVIVNKGSAKVDVQTGEIVSINNGSIISTMPIHIDVVETAVENSDIESSYEFNALNKLLEEVNISYEEIILAAKSWAVGGTGIRSGEDTDNSKYYARQSFNSSSAANTSALNAANSEELAEEHMQDTLLYSQNASTYMTNAGIYMESAKTSENNAYASETSASNSASSAKTSETNAKTSEVNSKTSETNAKTSETNAKSSETNALTYMNDAKDSKDSAQDNAKMSQSYAVGGTGIRDGEDTNNSQYYYALIKNMVNGLDTGFIPMGTISFSELSTVEKGIGYVYNIRDDFMTDESFAEGTDKLYTAGTNVYCRSDGLWDCFGGSVSPIATVDEVKSYLGI